MNKLFLQVLNPFKQIVTCNIALINCTASKISISKLIRTKKNKSNIKTTIYQNENSEVNKVLQNSINKLPTKHREVFLMKNIHNYKTEDICEELGIARTTFWKIIHEARLKLMNDLKEKTL